MLFASAILYFSGLAFVLWWLGRSNLKASLKIVATMATIMLVPAIVYVDGKFRELGDGGAANTVFSFLVFWGGFLTACAVYVARSISHESNMP